MEVSIKDLSDVAKELQISLTASEIQPHFDKAYQENRQNIEIKGFRKGKAPLELVKKLYGESIEYDTLPKIANEYFRQVATERKIEPFGEPRLKNINYNRGTDLTFTVSLEVKPIIELKDYSNIEIDKFIHTITDNEIEDEITRLRHANSTVREVETATDDEHVITVDIQELDKSGSPLIGKKTSDVKIYLADESIISEVRKSLQSVTVGEQKQIQFQDTREEKSNVYQMNVVIKKIEKIELPELNDEFAQKITKGKINNLNALRQHIRSELESYWKEQSERGVMNAMVGEIVRRHDFSVPESFINAIIDERLKELKKRYPNKKLPTDFDEQKFREESRPYAIFQAKWTLDKTVVTNLIRTIEIVITSNA